MQITPLRQLTGGQYPLQRYVEVVVYVGFSRTWRFAPTSTLGRLCRFRRGSTTVSVFATGMVLNFTC